mgnify:CR=1 FL=1
MAVDWAAEGEGGMVIVLVLWNRKVSYYKYERGTEKLGALWIYSGM